MVRSLLVKAAAIAAGGLMMLSFAAPVGATGYTGTVYFNRLIPEIRSADPNQIDSSKVIYNGGTTKDVKSSPNGGLVAFLRAYDSGNYNLWIMTNGGSNLFNLTADGTIDVDSYDWKSNGKTIVWSDGDNLFTTDLDDDSVTQITSTVDVDTNPHYRPGGSTALVFNRNIGGNNEVFKYDFVSDTATRLTNNVADDRVAANGNPWEVKDGVSRIFFQSDRSPTHIQIFKMAPDGGSLQQLTTAAYDHTDINVSPSGSLVAYTRGGAGLDLISVLGVFQRRLITIGIVDRVVWSPTSSGLVFTLEDQGLESSRVGVVNVAGTSRHRVAAMNASHGLDWGN